MSSAESAIIMQWKSFFFLSTKVRNIVNLFKLKYLLRPEPTNMNFL